MLTHPVLLYDGDCAFCRQWVARLQRWDHDSQIRYVPARDRLSVPDLPLLDEAALERAMHLVTRQGDVYAGAEALPPVLRMLPALRWLAGVFRLPGMPRLSGWVYSEIAKRRHRLGCGSAQCRIGQA